MFMKYIELKFYVYLCLTWIFLPESNIKNIIIIKETRDNSYQ